MKLILFALLCFITLLLIRAIQGSGSPPRTPRRRPGGEGPPAPPSDIVDVPFEELKEGRKEPPKESPDP